MRIETAITIVPDVVRLRIKKIGSDNNHKGDEYTSDDIHTEVIVGAD